jgi:hypothetical protein
MSWISQHKLIFIIIIVLIVGGVWYGLSQGSTPAPALTTSTAGAGTGTASAPAAGQDLVGTLLTLRAVTLSGTIFSEPAFAHLQDFGTTIVPEPVGRTNPFAPLTIAAATTTQSQHAAQIFAPKK